MTSAPRQPALSFIDLFCGCGGFSLGLQRAGLRCLAAIDFNAQAIEVFRANFPEVPHVLMDDVLDYGPRQIAARIGTNRIDVIAGGLNFRGFSTVQQRDGSNHSTERIKGHPRRRHCSVFLAALLAPAAFSARPPRSARRTSDLTLAVQI